MTNNLNKIIL